MQKPNGVDFVDFIVFMVNLSPLLIPTAILSVILFFYSMVFDINNQLLMIVSGLNYKIILPFSVVIIVVYIILFSFLCPSDFEPKN